MIISKLFGGLGNQLFQYALGRYLSILNNTELKLDISLLKQTPENITYRTFELDKFHIKATIATDDEIKRIKREHLKGLIKSLYWRFQYQKPYYKQNYVKEAGFFFDKNILHCGNNIYLDGYWQSPYYFEEIKPVLLQELIPKNDLGDIAYQYLKQILNSNSVSLHIRRGDYITNPKNKEIYLEINNNYYKQAISFMNNKIDTPTYFVFSDDLHWIKENLNIENSVFIDIERPVDSLYLMSKCKHNIITNSTFSWWGAWLNNNPEKIVVTPKEWFVTERLKTNDLLPKNWIKI